MELHINYINEDAAATPDGKNEIVYDFLSTHKIKVPFANHGYIQQWLPGASFHCGKPVAGISLVNVEWGCALCLHPNPNLDWELPCPYLSIGAFPTPGQITGGVNLDRDYGRGRGLIPLDDPLWFRGQMSGKSERCISCELSLSTTCSVSFNSKHLVDSLNWNILLNRG